MQTSVTFFVAVKYVAVVLKEKRDTVGLVVPYCCKKWCAAILITPFY
jgi:hypothetical protein